MAQQVPQVEEASTACDRAQRTIDAPTKSLPVDAKGKESAVPADKSSERRLLWIDGVGVYLLCLDPRASLGQVTPDAEADITIYADISRLHAYLTRDGEGYVLDAVRPVTINQKSVTRTLLRDGERFTLGTSCQVRFHQPLGLSATARLEVMSGHRLRLSLDGVLLMAETCILGPEGEVHLPVPDARRTVVLFRAQEQLGVRIPGEFAIDGRTYRDYAVLGRRATVAWDDCRFTLEPYA